MGKQARRQAALAKAQEASSLGDESTGTPNLRAQVAPDITAGVMGTSVFGGFVEVKETNPELVGLRKWQTFSDMLQNVSIVTSGVRYYLNLVSQPGWSAVPADDSQEAEQVAMHVQSCMDDLRTPWNRVIRRAALFRTHGYSIQEWTAKRNDDGSIGMLDVQSRPQSTIYQWDVRPDGEVLGVGQLNPMNGHVIYLPRAKIVYVVDDSITDNPEGNGLLRHLAEPTRILRRYQQLEGWGFETDLRGIPMGRAPFTALNDLVERQVITTAQRDEILKPLRSFVEGHIKNPQLGLLLDSMTYEAQDGSQTPSSNRQWDLDLLKAGATGQAEVAASIERLMRDIARVLGVEHLLMGDNGVGSFAMAKDKSHNFALMIDGALRDLQQAFMADWVAQIMLLNGWDKKLTPSLKTDKLQYRSVEQLTSALADMARAGAVLAQNDPAIAEVRDLMGLSRPIEIAPEIYSSLLRAPQVPPLQEDQAAREAQAAIAANTQATPVADQPKP